MFFARVPCSFTKTLRLFLLELLFLENAVNRSDISSFSFACNNRRFGLPGDFSVAFFFFFGTFWNDLREFSIENVKTVPYQV